MGRESWTPQFAPNHPGDVSMSNANPAESLPGSQLDPQPTAAERTFDADAPAVRAQSDSVERDRFSRPPAPPLDFGAARESGTRTSQPEPWRRNPGLDSSHRARCPAFGPRRRACLDPAAFELGLRRVRSGGDNPWPADLRTGDRALRRLHRASAERSLRVSYHRFRGAFGRGTRRLRRQWSSPSGRGLLQRLAFARRDSALPQR